MELRQLRYFLKVVECGSMGRAALDLGVVTSALSQQLSRLEGELSTRLLQRSPTGVVPTDAGLAFMRQAQLAVRHADEAVRSAQQARLAGHASVGFAPTTASVIGVPLLAAMRERYPAVRLHLVESLSGHLAKMLNARQLDVAVLFRADDGAARWSVQPLLDERLFLIAAPGRSGEDGDAAALPSAHAADAGGAARPGVPPSDAGGAAPVRLADLGTLPLVLPSASHGLRALVDDAFARAGRRPTVVAEIDGLALLMNAVRAGLAATVQPGAVVAARLAEGLIVRPIADDDARRRNLLASLADDELSPAARAARRVVADVARTLVRRGAWPGASLHEPGPPEPGLHES